MAILWGQRSIGAKRLDLLLPVGNDGADLLGLLCAQAKLPGKKTRLAFGAQRAALTTTCK